MKGLVRAVRTCAVLAFGLVSAGAAEKTFRRDELADRAIKLEAQIKSEAGPVAKSAATLRTDADVAFRRSDMRGGLQILGQIVAITPEDGANWLRLAKTVAQIRPANASEGTFLNERAATAAYMAYHRAANAGEEAEALAVLGRAMAERKLYRPALDALRLSLDLREIADIREQYEKMRGDHGFRLLDYSVDSDSASPRACFQFSEDLAKRVDFAPFLALAGNDKPALSAEDRQLCVEGLKHGERYNINLRAGLPSTVKESLPKSAEFNIYVRDRKPFVRFTGRAYVLPRTGQKGIPLVSVNTLSATIDLSGNPGDFPVCSRNVRAIVRMGKYLTRRGQTYVFQLRPPKSVDPDFRLSPIRVTLGRVTAREARQLANILVGQAQLAFAAVGKGMDVPGKATSNQELKRLMLLAGPFLKGLDAVADIKSSTDGMAKLMAKAGLDGLIGIGIDRAANAHLATHEGEALTNYFIRVIKDEATARSHLDLAPLSPKPTEIENIAARLDLISERIEGISGQLEPKSGPLFSVAADAYYAKIKKAKGTKGHKKDGSPKVNPELSYIEHRRNVFLQLMPDRPVSSYTEEDIQDFVDELQWLDPDYSTSPDYQVGKIKEFIQENKSRSGPRLARGTIENNYLPRIFSIIRHGCKMDKIPYPLDGCRIIFSDEIPKPKNQIPPDYTTLNRIFRKGLATGVLADALLPPLGYVVGRRLGIIAFLRAEHIRPYHGCYIVAPHDIVQIHEASQQLIVPIKTEVSLNFYVLHNFFVDCGLVGWMMRQEGFIFKLLHEAEDPADAASKRMQRLFEGVADPHLYQTYHGLRHGRKNEDIDNSLSPAASRIQAGRAPGSDDDMYGQGHLTAAQVKMIANAPLSPEIDWRMFERRNWDEYAARARWPRHFKTNWDQSGLVS